MLKIYIPDHTNNPNPIGGGWTAKNNLIRGLGNRVELVDTLEKADILFVFSITATRTGEIEEAKKGGRKIVLRVDNIPRKSRNHRMDAVGRLKEIGALADVVIYQSNWAKMYTGYLIKNDTYKIIRNGVATEIFNTKNRNSDGYTYLYLNYNDNPNKRFDEALYWFDMAWRKDNKSHLIIGGSVPRIYLEHPEYNWDLPIRKQGVKYVGVITNQVQVAMLMKTCDFLLIPYFAEASSNTLAEGLACGLELIAVNSEGGNIEIVEDFKKNGIRTIQKMAEEYLTAFSL